MTVHIQRSLQYYITVILYITLAQAEYIIYLIPYS